jgi:hypothetical protein
MQNQPPHSHTQKADSDGQPHLLLDSQLPPWLVGVAPFQAEALKGSTCHSDPLPCAESMSQRCGSDRWHARCRISPLKIDGTAYPACRAWRVDCHSSPRFGRSRWSVLVHVTSLRWESTMRIASRTYQVLRSVVEIQILVLPRAARTSHLCSDEAQSARLLASGTSLVIERLCADSSPLLGARTCSAPPPQHSLV